MYYTVQRSISTIFRKPPKSVSFTKMEADFLHVQLITVSCNHVFIQRLRLSEQFLSGTCWLMIEEKLMVQA